MDAWKTGFLLIAVLLLFFVIVDNATGLVYDVCEAMSDEEVSYNDFSALVEAIYNDECNEAINVKTTFSMSKKDFEDIAYTYGAVDSEENALVFFRSGTPSAIGMGAILVYGNEGDFPVKVGDRLHIWTAGSPKDIIFEVSIEGCDPYDDKCDAICSYDDDFVCDPKCYVDDARENVACDIDCVDVNGNHRVDAGDLDGICDLDCYNDDLDPKRAYDPDCVDIFSNDTVCDPDSQGVIDGVCDPDCAPANHICDFDCNSTVYTGNPNALNDTDCYECDRKCNGFCSYACTDLDNDPDCPEGFTGWFELTECCGNGNCASGEDCQGCKEDCPPNNVSIPDTEQNCSIFNVVPTDDFYCCPDADIADRYGCANFVVKKAENETCACVPECDSGLVCNGPEGDEHCCPAGKVWNGTLCKTGGSVLIVALKSNLLSTYSAGQMTTLENKINEFISALSADGLDGTFMYLDEDETALVTPGGVKVTDPGDWNDIDAVLNALIPKMKSKYLIIIGGYDNFPQAPVGSNWGSDDPYGDTDGDGSYRPDIPVGRIPAPNGGDIDVMLNTMDTAIKLHKAGGIALDSHISPIMGASSYGCGGYDARDWNSGRCTCTDVWADSPCNSVCGNIELSRTTAKDFVIVLAHGPGASATDLLHGGSVNADPSSFNSLDLSDAVWMSMACGGAHLKLKSSTSNSIAMTYLKNGGAVFFGSSDNNYGNMGSCAVPGGDCCIGSIYTEVGTRFTTGTRIGDAFMEGKNAFFEYPTTQGCSCGGGHFYQYHINYLLGDPTLKIKSKW